MNQQETTLKQELGQVQAGNIADNNFGGPETVDISGVYALQISGPCTWVLVP